MWTSQRSVTLSKISILCFAVCLAAVAAAAPWLVRWLIFPRPFLQGTETYFLITIYLGCIPAAGLLYTLYRLLQSISQEEVFTPDNVDHLRYISWCCFIGGTLCLLSGFYYFPWFLLAIAAGFMGLIVRVVKNVVARAVSLQDEVNYTV